MSSRNLWLCVLGAAVAIALAPATGLGQTEPAEWDQERATALAQDLVEAVKGLRESARKDPPATLGGAKAASRYRLLDKLRLIEAESKTLASALRAGEGREETRPIFERIDESRRSAAEDARRLFTPKGTLDRMSAARDVLERLRPYYADRGAPLASPEEKG